ncbi:hypothetical protein BBJ28_00000619 [Nothophytophthora sp. Chile5]|nr:hypothetical protein BBJ28_00000619 [Nothophytophthora sp. Chile5]
MDRFLDAIGRVKPLEHFQHGTHTLKKCLTLVDLIAYGVGCSVGAGVYSLVGVGAQIAGPGISLSFLISGIACIFTSLTYSEFAARVPVTGSAYTFVYITFGELAAWLIGWNLTLGYGISAGTYTAAFPVSSMRSRTWSIYGMSCIAVLPKAAPAVTYGVFICLSLQESAKFNAFVTLLNISVLLFVVVFGSTEVETSYWEPFMPSGIHGVITGAGVVFFAYLGFDMVACLAEEVHEPQRTLPKGIIGSLVISMTIYVSVSLVVTGMAPVSVLGGEVPLVNAFKFHDAPWASLIVSFGSIFGLTTAAFTCLMGQPRIFYQMAKDGLLPSLFAKLNRDTQVPVASTIFTGVLVACISFVFELDFLANVISCGTLQVFTFVNAGVLLLRMRPALSGAGVVHRVLVYVTACLALSLSFVLDLHWTIQGAIAMLLIASFVFIYRLGKLRMGTLPSHWLISTGYLDPANQTSLFRIYFQPRWLHSWKDARDFNMAEHRAQHKNTNRLHVVGVMRDPASPVSASVRCLLPFQLPRSQSEAQDNADPNSSLMGCSPAPSSASRAEGDDPMLELYRQAVPLVQPHSTAAVKTLGKIVRNNELVKRMLQRPQPFAEQLDRRPMTYESPVASKTTSSYASSAFALPSSPSNFELPRTSGASSQRRLAFMAACEHLMVTFDPQVRQTRHLKLVQIKPLLRFHGLNVGDVAFRSWEQRLSLSSPAEPVTATTPTVSVSAFIQACRLWFSESFLLDHVQQLSLWQQQQKREMKALKDKRSKLAPLNNRQQQSRSPFDPLVRESDAASTFSYEAYARRPPPPTAPLGTSASAPALLLHSNYCSRLKPDHATLATVAKLNKAKLRQRRLQKQTQAVARQTRLQNAEIAQAFATSVAMISRHVHNEEVRDLRESERDAQVARANQIRNWSQQHEAHCTAIKQDAREQRAREVCAMKALAQEELQLARDFHALREEVVRRSKPLFALSSSSSTIFQSPPEILAARATATTNADRSRLARVEREHAEHMRSLQLLDYAYDRKRLLSDATQPRADATLLEVAVADEELPADRIVQLAGDELWHQLVQQEPDNLALFVPPNNSPPAALRFFGTSRPVASPAFSSAVERDS